MTSGIAKLPGGKVGSRLRPATVTLQAAKSGDRAFQGLSVPIVRASTVVFKDAAAFDGRYAEFYDGFTYGLFGTPTSRALEEQLSLISGAARTLLVPSGQAALSLVFLAFLKPGDQILLPDSVYGPVRSFASSWLKEWDVDAVFYDPLVASDIKDLITPATRIVLVESPGSNTMEIQDIPAISGAARAVGALTVADTTWATPLHFNAFSKGVDITIDALSKYASGHGDVLMGGISTDNEAHYRRLKDMTRLFGVGVSPDDCSLVLRGLQTMPLRIERSSASALLIANHLASRSEIDAVLHPALTSDPGHKLWKRDFTGASGIFSFILADRYKGDENDLIDQLKLFAIGASWGSARSVVAPQDPTNGRTATRWTRGKLIRLSIGLEDPEDLIADLDQAINHIRNVASTRPEITKPAA
jgi:cysteine-S-conjugate beta-lyase